MTYTPPARSMLDVQIKGSQWQGDAVDVLGTGKPEVDPTVRSARLGLTSVPALSLGLEHRMIQRRRAGRATVIGLYLAVWGAVGQQWQWQWMGAATTCGCGRWTHGAREPGRHGHTRTRGRPLFAARTVQQDVLEGERVLHKMVRCCASRCLPREGENSRVQ